MLQAILDLSKKLIAFESVKERPEEIKKLIAFCKKELAGFTIEEFEKNGSPSLLIYVGKTRPKRFKIILNAHLDVVPAKKEQFAMVEKNGRLWGRGTNDMKVGGAIEILLFKELARKVTYPLALQLVTDEEVGGFNGVKHQIEEGVRADFVIAAEPTDMGINNKAKGIIWAKVHVKGMSAHGAYPWNGKNAIWMMHEFMKKLQKEFPVPTKESWVTTVNVAKIETSNTAFNKVPDDCIVSLDIRYIPEDDKTIVDKLNKLSSPGVKVEVMMKEPSQFTNIKDPFVVKLADVIKSVTGKKAEIIVKHGAADIRHFNKVGCEGITFGPVGDGLHTDHEWCDIKSLEKYYEVFKSFLQQIN